MRTIDHELTRRLAALVPSVLTEEPAVALQGARTVGKSTLMRSLSAPLGREVIDLDDLAVRAAVAADPGLFAGSAPPVFFDEFQHVPELLDAIKAELNVGLRPGRFVLTGSTRYDSLPRAAQSLAGRLHVVTVWPLSQGELDGVAETFVEHLLSDPRALITAAPAATSRAEYLERVLGGGLPIPLSRPTPTGRSRWYDDYLRLLIERDVVELSRIRQREVMPRLLARLAGQTAQVLNVTSAGSELGLRLPTIESYVRLLEAVFVLYRLPAWGTTLRRRAASRPKIHMVDSGLAAHLLGADAETLGRLDPAALSQFGHVLETFCVGELLKQLSWLPGAFVTGHWRTHDGQEVDLVVERPDGGVVAIEVKHETRVGGRAFAGLRAIRDAVGERFVGGVVLHLGARSFTQEDRLHAVPVERLWMA